MSIDELHEFYRRYVDALNAREFHRLEEFVSDEISHFGDPVTRSQIWAALTGEVEAVPDLHWRLDALAVDGENLAARLTNTGTPAKEWLGVAATGNFFEITEYALYRVREGRFVHMSSVRDIADLQSQLGS